MATSSGGLDIFEKQEALKACYNARSCLLHLYLEIWV